MTTKTELTQEQKDILEENPPAWKVNIIANMQAQADKKFNEESVSFRSFAEGWLNNAKVAIGNGVTPPPFVAAIPQREVFYPAKDVIKNWFTVLEIDPSLQVPTAPPPITNPNRGNPISTRAGSNTDMQNAMLTHILNDLDAIKKVMNIT